jgi:WD40 repeat protein
MTTLKHRDTLTGPAGMGSLAFTRDGAMLAVAGGRVVTVWDVRTAQRKTLLTKHRDAVYAVAFSPSCKTIVSASADKTARVWDVHTGNLVVTLNEHTKEVTSVAFSPDGKTLATGSYDGTIILWDVAELLDR